MKASSIVASSATSLLFKSSFGFGKTLAAASFALEGPVYLSYFDKQKPVELIKYFTDKRFGSKAQKILDNIEYDIYGAHNAHEYLNKMINLSKDNRYFACITDSVTNLTAAAVNWSLGFRNPKDPKKDKLNSSAPAMIPDWDEYKVETSLVSQALDLQKSFNCHIIWTAHPLPGIKLEGTGQAARVTKTNPIVTYGSKVAGMVPGNFTEIYQFSKSMDYTVNPSRIKYLVSTEAIGDDYAKSPLLGDYVKEFDITDKLFYEVWKDLVDKAAGIDRLKTEEAIIPSNIINPFAPNPLGAPVDISGNKQWKV